MNSRVLSFSFSRLSDYWELTKPRLVSLTLWSVAAGMMLARKGPVDFHTLFLTLTGAALVAAGSMSLNQWLERVEDGRMARTENRPLPAGRLLPYEALRFGILLTLAGVVLLYVSINFLAAFLAFTTFVTYVGVYTPLKKRTSWCTLVGAVPGALPPLIGWTAATGNLSLQAWSLFAIIFFWQMPHFYAISWFCRKDYAFAGFRMLSVKDPSGKRVAWEMFIYTALMLPVSLLPFFTQLSGFLYVSLALIMGIGLIILAGFCLKDLDRYARLFFRASLLYLTLLFVFMVINKHPHL